ncbi:hypothetical protein BWQ96_04694 [Gracilariopsis chorda]|uniref:Uncharacterized protein n=1 Tax=Gracilariopsis chorda TaxID=448386 RepID=A0A2V3ITU8_9FLOR|nr:hypothetical protein BWQ96_04694 [Gracilariopsis chorda]|eukprot:PXF45556.1 hypothetical protein BWQ96_04694 [Gracilariopsis chorda]
MDLSELSSEIYRRTQAAKSSTIRLAPADLFVGPLIGRSTSHTHLVALANQIVCGVDFHVSQALLVVKGYSGLALGKLLVVGGSHRLLVSAHLNHMLLIPYRLINLSGMGTDNIIVQLKRYDGIIAHHVESSAPRPQMYTIMHQVLMYSKLKEFWTLQQINCRTQTRTTRARPHSMTQNKLLHLYKVLQTSACINSRHAIQFLDVTLKPNSIRGYMSGADKLLHADVLLDLCYLDKHARTRFSCVSINTVRNWSLHRIQKTVKYWKSKSQCSGASNFVCRFSDDYDPFPSANEEDHDNNGSQRSKGDSPLAKHILEHPAAKKRRTTITPSAITSLRRQQKQQGKDETNDEVQLERQQQPLPTIPTRNIATACNTKTPSPSPKAQRSTRSIQTPKRAKFAFLPPLGWDGYVNWDLQGNMTLLHNLQRRLENEHVAKTDVQAQQHTVPYSQEERIRIVNMVKNEFFQAPTTLVCAQLHNNTTNKDLNSSGKPNHPHKPVLAATRGFLQTTLSLSQQEVRSIHDCSMASDQTIMFTFSFLNSWTEPSSKKEMYILDPQLVAAWWDTVLREGSSTLDRLSAKVRDFRNTSTKRKSNPHDKIWTSKLSIVMLCGHNHWTLVAFANLPLLLERLERAPHMLKRSHKQQLKQYRATMLCVDSMSANHSPHALLSQKIVHYLTASYPGQNVVSFRLLSSLVTTHHLRRSIQQHLECGFFTTYHIEIISKQISTFLNGSEMDVQKHFNIWYTKFHFTHYVDCIRHRMEALMHTFEENGQAPVPCNMFTASAQQPLKQATGTTHPSVPHTKTPINPEAFNAQHTVHQRGEANQPKTPSKRDGFYDGKR